MQKATQPRSYMPVEEGTLARPRLLEGASGLTAPWALRSILPLTVFLVQHAFQFVIPFSLLLRPLSKRCTLRIGPLAAASLAVPKFLRPKRRTSTIPTMSLHDSRIHKWFATSPPVAWTIRQLRELLIGSLKQGPIPQHVAFVMDGNRRFARNHHIETVEGHNLGFESLARVWQNPPALPVSTDPLLDT
jgi:hypothetical protein